MVFKRIVYLLVVLFVFKAQGQDRVFVSASGGAFYEVNLSTCNSRQVANFGRTLLDIAVNPVDGQLYGTDNDGLYLLDTITGTAVLVGQLPTNMNALTGSSSGVFYAANSFNDSIYLINTQDASISVLGSTGTGVGSAGDLAFYQERLYLAGTFNRLVEIDLSDISNSTVVGTLDNLDNVHGVASVGCPDQFLAFNRQDIYSVNSENPSETSLLCAGVISLGSISGAAAISESLLGKPALGADTVLCFDDTLFLDATVTGNDIVYRWQDESNSASYNVVQSGTYIVSAEGWDCLTGDTIVIDYENCEDCDAYVENTFTPNDDGLNDVFSPTINCNVEEYNLRIYTRWGEEVFYSVDASEEWDGKLNNKQLPAGMYSYILTFKQVRGASFRFNDKLLLLR